MILERAAPAPSCLLHCVPRKPHCIALELMQGQKEPAPSSAPAKPKKNVVVLVLGDIGRSPRMQYHTLSLANVEEVDIHVDLIGYKGRVQLTLRLYHISNLTSFMKTQSQGTPLKSIPKSHNMASTRHLTSFLGSSIQSTPSSNSPFFLPNYSGSCFGGSSPSTSFSFRLVLALL